MIWLATTPMIMNSQKTPIARKAQPRLRQLKAAAALSGALAGKNSDPGEICFIRGRHGNIIAQMSPAQTACGLHAYSEEG